MKSVKELVIDTSLNTKKLTKQLEVISHGIELIVNSLNKIEKGCPECGCIAVKHDYYNKVDEVTQKVMCNECGHVYMRKG